MDLTYKQRLFVEFYLGEANGNATEAARRAGYAWPQKVAERLVGKSGIRAAIDSRLASAAMSANEILARLSEHASGDLGDYFRVAPDGTPSVDLRKAKRAKRTRVIKKLKVKTKTFTTDHGESVEVQTEIELHNPQFALDKLAQFHGLYEAKPKAEASAGRPRIAIPGSSPDDPGGPKAPRGPRKRKPPA